MSDAISYTIHSVPCDLDEALRQVATEQKVSLNEAVLQTLRRGLNVPEPGLHHDLDFMIGIWVEDPQFDDAIDSFRRVDEDMWK